MTEDDFRSLALAQPDAVEGGHMGQADFRVGGKIFATLDPKAGLGTLKLTAEQQEVLVAAIGAAVFPANGSWGAKGWTKLKLSDLNPADIEAGMRMAWTGIAPKSLLAQHGVSD